VIWRRTKDASQPGSLVAISEPISGMRLLDAIVQALPDPVLVLSREGGIIAANGPAEEILGGNLTGKPVSLTVRSPAILDAVAGVTATGFPAHAEFERQVPFERRFDAFVAPIAFPASPGDGLPTPLVLIMFKDLTREQQLERMRADFVANASHELRTPLASLLGFIETLQGPARSDATARKKFLEMMRSQAGRMQRLIDDLLSLSRIELNAHRRPTAVVDLTSIVNQANELLAGMAREARVTVNLDVAPGLMVIGDADELMQVMQNLMENALKYAGAGKRIDITAGLMPHGEVEASVADYGPGIAGEHIPRLTERFYRVSVQESRSRGGTGLGLAIVKHILNHHRGKLIIFSEMGKGSRFTIRLPAAP
jgi:two-component system phosphate regulon sensor histidine kinase PhoR